MANRAMQTADVREKLFTIRMNEDETARLEMLAEHYGLTAAGVVRMLLKREADTIAREREENARGRARRAKAEAEVRNLSEQYQQTPWTSAKPKKR